MQNKAKKEEQTYRPGEVMTMFESLKKDIGLISEGHGGLVKKMDDLSEKVDKNHRELTGRIDGLSCSVNERFDGIDANLKVALEYLFRIDEEIQDIKTGIKELKDSIKGKAEKEKVLQMEKRLEMLEKEFMLYKKRAMAGRN